MHVCSLPTIESDDVIQLSTLSRVSGFLWHSSKWACWFDCFFQYTSGLEVSASSFDTTFNYYTPTLPFLEPLSKVAATVREEMDFKISFFLDLRSPAKFSDKMHKLLRPLAEYLAALPFFCCRYIDPYITSLTVDC